VIEGAILRSIETARSEAIAFERAGDTDRASARLDAVGRLYLQLADRTASRELEATRRALAEKFLKLSRRLAEGQPSAPPPEASSVRGGSVAEARIEKAEGERSPAQRAVLDLLTKSPVRWDQIGGLERTKHEIKLALAISLAKRPDGVAIESWRNLLFYGPPGTGKTLLAAATSNALKPRDGTLESSFFNVKVSSVLSKYFGESSKIISELYGTAREISPAVVFLDEFESLTGERDGGDSGAERRILSTILAELDGLSEKGRADLFVMTIAATNRPWDIDPAVLSRFEKKVLIPLPDDTSRERILEILLLRRGFVLEFPLVELVPLTAGYSGRELDRLVKEVTGWMVAGQNADLVELFDRDPDQARAYAIRVRPLTLDDFRRAAAGIVPQTGATEMARYHDWARGLES